MKFLYRPDIDGLRAISILGVILFHFKFDFFSGGYLGVDVFIVISGFLITSFIFKRLELNKFSFSEFLIRRAKRLLPSFFVVIFLSLIFAYFIFLPEDLVKFCKSLISAASLSSNFFFWLNSGYWDESNINPLLHTWSLSLEWQFYLSFSIFSVLIWKLVKLKFYKLTIILFVFLFISSFFSAVLFMDRSMSFFLLPFRLYEFLIGSLIYFIRDQKFLIIEKNKEFFSFFGIFLIIFSFIIFDSESNVPGYIALMPCLGATLLIYQSDSIVHNFLKNKIFVYLGLISYSLYLYHWPVLVFYSWINIIELDLITKLLLIILSLVLSIINFHIIEKPYKNNSKLKKYINYIFLLALLIVILFVQQTISNKGYPDRFSDKKNNLIESISKDVVHKRKKFLNENIDLKFNKNIKNKILVLGDSNGEDMFMALRQNINTSDIEYIEFSAWCFERSKVNLIFKYFERMKKRNLKCTKEKNLYDKNLKLFKDADYIILSSSWFKGIDIYIEDIINFVKSYSDANIIISSKTINFPHILKLTKRIDEKNIQKINYIAYETKIESVDRLNKKLKKKIDALNMNYLDKSDLICSDVERKCSIFNFEMNTFYLIDNHHWTLEGAKYYGGKININKIFNNF
jgi:peptidoglycan/LPS O-acetylase OafA/YrhL